LKTANRHHRPNVVLIILDTARALNFSCYGYGRQTTPNIDRIAREGVLFENAISPSPWTLPAHASIFTGMYPSGHGCHEKHKFLSPDFDSLPQILKRNGYRTVGISNNSWVSRSFGFGKGFDKLLNMWQLVQSEIDIADPVAIGVEKYKKAAGVLLRGNPFVNALNAVYGKAFWRQYDYGARRINRTVKKLLNGGLGAGEPFFLFINYLEPHLVYKAPEPFWGKFLPDGSSREEAGSVNQDAWGYVGGVIPMSGRDHDLLTALYDAELAYLDYRIEELFGLLAGKGMLDDTLVLITSDHGENIGEHGLMDHQYCLYDTLLKVPLIARYPAVWDGGAREDGVVQTTGILPTVLEIVQLEANGRIQGESLLGTGGGGYAISEYLGPQPPVDAIHKRYPKGDFSKFDRSLFSIRSRDWKFIEASDGRNELYDVSKDPGETQNVIELFPAVCRDLSERLQRWKQEPGGACEEGDEAHISNEIKKRLEALGYLS
jgi:arylsulfatase A-like enzyme